MQLSQEIASYAPSYSRLLAELIQLLHQIALAQVVTQQFDLSPEQAKLLSKFAQVMSPEEVQLYYQIVLNGRKDLPYAADEQAAFDMVILRLLAFKPMINVRGFENNTVEKESASNKSINFSSEDLAATEINQSKTNPVIAPVIVPRSATENAETTIDASTEKLSTTLAPKSATSEDDLREHLARPLTENITEFSPEISSVTSSVTAVKEPLVEQNNAEIQQFSVKNEPLASVESGLSSNVSTSVDAILADRNMLRSRRKSQEDSSKKFSDANERQTQTQQQKLVKAVQVKEEQIKNLPHAESLPATPFTPDIIDPAQIRKANQVDKWAHMIDSMALSGRIRQLAIHATVDKSSTDDCLRLNLDQATKHLVSENAHQQLEDKLTELLKCKITVELNVVGETEADPYKIQSHINDKRYQYAKELLAQDEIVQTLQQDYQATIDESTIKAL